MAAGDLTLPVVTPAAGTAGTILLDGPDTATYQEGPPAPLTAGHLSARLNLPLPGDAPDHQPSTSAQLDPEARGAALDPRITAATVDPEARGAVIDAAPTDARLDG